MRPMARADRVAVVDEADVVYLAKLPAGPALVLRDVSAVVFREVTSADEGDVAQRVAAALDVGIDELDLEALQGFVQDLVDDGLLVET